MCPPEYSDEMERMEQIMHPAQEKVKKPEEENQVTFGDMIAAHIEASTSDGSTASYYELPSSCSELQHLISYKDMNAQMGEIFRACYRYGQCSHSDKLRDIKKILFYANAEKDRLEKLGEALEDVGLKAR